MTDWKMMEGSKMTEEDKPWWQVHGCLHSRYPSRMFDVEVCFLKEREKLISI